MGNKITLVRRLNRRNAVGKVTRSRVLIKYLHMTEEYQGITSCSFFCVTFNGVAEKEGDVMNIKIIEFMHLSGVHTVTSALKIANIIQRGKVSEKDLKFYEMNMLKEKLAPFEKTLCDNVKRTEYLDEFSDTDTLSEYNTSQCSDEETKLEKKALDNTKLDMMNAMDNKELSEEDRKNASAINEFLKNPTHLGPFSVVDARTYETMREKGIDRTRLQQIRISI